MTEDDDEEKGSLQPGDYLVYDDQLGFERSVKVIGIEEDGVYIPTFSGQEHLSWDELDEVGAMIYRKDESTGEGEIIEIE